MENWCHSQEFFLGGIQKQLIGENPRSYMCHGLFAGYSLLNFQRGKELMDSGRSKKSGPLCRLLDCTKVPLRGPDQTVIKSQITNDSTLSPYLLFKFSSLALRRFIMYMELLSQILRGFSSKKHGCVKFFLMGIPKKPTLLQFSPTWRIIPGIVSG